MGLPLSTMIGSLFPGQQQSPPPPPPMMVVLVPPFFQRDVRGLSRFCRSSYDYLGHRKDLSRLLRDHLSPELRGTLLLSPHDDPRVSVRAKLRQAGGSMVLRWQPASAMALHTFLEMAASLESPGDVALRASYLHPATGLGAFVVAPLARQLSGEAAKVGLRYSSSTATAGAIFVPRSGQLDKVWVAGRTHGLTLGVQLSPGLPVRQLLTAAADTAQHVLQPCWWAPTATAPAADGGGASASTSASAGAPLPVGAGVACGGAGGGGGALQERLAQLGFWLRSRSSVLLSYSSAHAAAPTGPTFTAAVELEEGRALTFSFFQHLAATRQVINPFEEDEVVGITNYLDIGLQLTTPIGPHSATVTATSGSGAAPAAASTAASAEQPQPSPPAAGHKAHTAAAAADGGGSPATINLAAAWQVNKNWLLKFRVGSDSAAAAVGARVWHVVSAYLTASVSVDYTTMKPRYGAELCVENFGQLRYERGADDVVAGRALLQRHEASPQDLANFAGRGVLVRRTTAPSGGGSSSSSGSGGGGGSSSGSSDPEQRERQRVAELM